MSGTHVPHIALQGLVGTLCGRLWLDSPKLLLVSFTYRVVVGWYFSRILRSTLLGPVPVDILWLTILYRLWPLFHHYSYAQSVNNFWIILSRLIMKWSIIPTRLDTSDKLLSEREKNPPEGLLIVKTFKWWILSTNILIRTLFDSLYVLFVKRKNLQDKDCTLTWNLY